MSEIPNDDEPVTVLTEEQCWDLLTSEQVGRLVVVVDERPEIYPVNYAVRDRKVYFRSGEGSKLAELTVHPQAAFEVDHISEDNAWSVVVHGLAHILRHFSDVQAVDALGLTPWVPTPKYNYVELTATEITGRKFILVKH
ncbi:pyridoxamine 5'-phosphate oxidase family protein [Rhodococcus chondri]|uniref:Pyridoxamine 5'-phosphate oxidase family protein n=1 Tax=Rhodococcus chondri TaxID=3065941 RepID=A0ABU7JNR3_9NOCA|nr:pyridoxamine 5'-phosphate oxidase family protein [Rhodococcus sp. CC-R104]MEE2031676.1 pyridoxamine 5'-phosphate oxidase family protein [Rhodococcus sp. CC-R104]